MNPPGKHVYLRDYYCSKISQADYLNHPIDLVMLSGRLHRLFELHLIDAIADRLDSRQCLEQIASLNPALLVGLTASVSFREDVGFYRSLQGMLRRPLYLGGDLLLEDRAERLRDLFFVDGFIHDFSGPDLPALLAGHPPESLKNLTLRLSDGRVVGLPIERGRGTRFELPVPVHQLFIGKPYRYPFVGQPFATVLTTFGCPYRCNFCVMAGLGWKARTVSNVLAELAELARLQVRELLILDQTFGVPRPQYAELLDEIIRAGFGFGWVCFSRADVVDSDLVDQMRTAGCHTLILGLESGNQGILDAAQKDIALDDIIRGFRVAGEGGLRTVATVLIGLPEETEETFQETLAFLELIGPDFASFNVAVPRVGTGLRDRAIRLGLIESGLQVMDQSGSIVAMPSLVLSRADIGRMRRRAIRRFYFRLAYAARRLNPSGLSPAHWWGEVRRQGRQGFALMRKYWKL